MLMLPATTGNAARVQQEVTKLRGHFNATLDTAQQSLAQKYAALQNDPTIKKIKRDFEAGEKGEEGVALEALEINTKDKTKYNHPP